MFAQAGFREDGKAIVAAIVSVHGRAWRRPAFLIRFPGTDDMVWLGDEGISWPHQVRICRHPQVKHGWVPAIDMESSELQE